MIARTGAFNLFGSPSISEPRFDEILPALAPPALYAVQRATRHGMYYVLLLDRSHRPFRFIKLATGDVAKRRLDAERRGLQAASQLLRPPLVLPRLLEHSESFLLFEAIPWQVRKRPTSLSESVALALGGLFASKADPNRTVGFGHGDFAPWNILQSGSRLYVIDWEEAGLYPPFHDIFHFLVSGYALLGSPTAPELLAGLAGRGRIGKLISAYATAAALDETTARWHLRLYLSSTVAQLPPDGPDHHRARSALQRLINVVGENGST